MAITHIAFFVAWNLRLSQQRENAAGEYTFWSDCRVGKKKNSPW
jgi:hypothetical protein